MLVCGLNQVHVQHTFRDNFSQGCINQQMIKREFNNTRWSSFDMRVSMWELVKTRREEHNLIDWWIEVNDKDWKKLQKTT